MDPLRKTLAFVLFCALYCGGYSINCFYCNSANNSACIDMNKYDGETLAKIVPVIECRVPGRLPDNDQPQFFCRKLVQTIFHSDRETELRVTRGCGWVRDDKDCYRSHHSDHIDIACQCFQDMCNAADSADPVSSVLLFIVFSAVLYFYR